MGPFALPDLLEFVFPEQCLTLQGRDYTMAPSQCTELQWNGERKREGRRKRKREGGRERLFVLGEIKDQHLKGDILLCVHYISTAISRDSCKIYLACIGVGHAAGVLKNSTSMPIMYQLKHSSVLTRID